MPKQVLPTEEDFKRIKKTLISWGFWEIPVRTTANELRRRNLKAPRPRKGRETGFRYDANGLTVIVWTTWLKQYEHAREKDTGWILIREGEEVKYFDRPTHRTAKFVYHLLKRAQIAKERVDTRPLCPECGALMKIASGRGLKSRYWRCSDQKSHASKKPIRYDWDYGLSPESKEYVISRRKKRAHYRRQREQQSKPPPGTAMLRRKTWKPPS
jgi:tRNA(Ile2) C34 agmatinyltransferase TiaS